MVTPSRSFIPLAHRVVVLASVLDLRSALSRLGPDHLNNLADSAEQRRDDRSKGMEGGQARDHAGCDAKANKHEKGTREDGGVHPMHGRAPAQVAALAIQDVQWTCSFPSVGIPVPSAAPLVTRGRFGDLRR